LLSKAIHVSNSLLPWPEQFPGPSDQRIPATECKGESKGRDRRQRKKEKKARKRRFRKMFCGSLSFLEPITFLSHKSQVVRYLNQALNSSMAKRELIKCSIVFHGC
jgi:hypothetical protein